MIKRPFVAALAVSALLRCGDNEPPPMAKAPQPPNPELLHIKGPDDSDDRNNLLNFAHGAVAISRTGEFSLELSAQCAIDGDPVTPWVSPPDEPDQSLVFALPARTRVKSLGLLVAGEAEVQPRNVTFDVSADGRTFSPASTFAMPPSGKNIVDIKPAEANYVRFSTRGGGHFVRAVSVFARGELLEPVRPGSLDGCWSINGVDAAFVQNGAYVTGSVAGKVPIVIDGGRDGRFYRLLWLRGPQYGIIGLAVTPDARHLSGTFWHEESYNRFATETWFGEKKPCAAASRPDEDVMATSMQRYGRYAMYGLQFDDSGRLVEDASAPMLDRLVAYLRTSGPVRIESHELLQPDGAHNRSVSQAKIDSLRPALSRRGANLGNVDFVAVGSDKPHRPASTDAARSIYGAVELIRR